MTASTLRTALIEDEPQAMAHLRSVLARAPGVEIVAEASTAAAARRALLETAPDLAFLDVALPDGDAMQLVNGLPPGAAPAFVFVTAYDRFAVEAFRVRAVDYVLKPYEDDRVFEALGRARRHLAATATAPSIAPPGESAAAPAPRPDRVAIRSKGRILLLPVAEIAWIDASGVNCRIHTADGATHTIRRAISDFERDLDPRQFPRIHRSTIVNLRFLRELLMNDSGDYAVVLTTGDRLNVSRTCRARLEALF